MTVFYWTGCKEKTSFCDFNLHDVEESDRIMKKLLSAYFSVFSCLECNFRLFLSYLLNSRTISLVWPRERMTLTPRHIIGMKLTDKRLILKCIMLSSDLLNGLETRKMSAVKWTRD